MLSPVKPLLLAASLLSSTQALQVTPNSACSSVCLDDSSQISSDASVSNTHGFDIVCQDGNYATTPAGQKFERCLNCLQNSSAVASGENDQAWFLYNLRFAFNACVFGTANATDPVTSPCSVDSVCGHLESALTDGMENPSTMAQYGYCSASQNAFMGTTLGTCRQCLAEATNEHYLSNFLVALSAGCTQQPPAGTRIGLNSTVFSPFDVVATSPQMAPSGSSSKNKTLSTAAIIGIGVAGGVLLLILAAILFIGIRKHRNATRLRALRSPLDPRFGARNITAPNKGAYTSPQSSPPIHPDGMPMKLVPVVNHNDPAPDTDDEWYEPPPTEQHVSYSVSPGPPSYSPPSSGRESIVPTHHAYIPPQYTPPSRNSISPLYSPPTFHHQSPPSSARSAPPAITNTSSSQPNSARSIPGNSLPLSARSMPAPHLQRSPPPPIFVNNPNQTTPTVRTNPITTTSIYAASSTNPTSIPTTTTRAASFSRPLTRTLTSGSRGPRKAPPTAVQISISRPIMRVESRFESEAQARSARERLYREGLGLGGGTMAVDANSRELPEQEGARERGSPESDVSEEMWPGRF